MHFETFKMLMKWINATGFIIITHINKFEIISIVDDTYCHLKYTTVKSMTYH